MSRLIMSYSHYSHYPNFRLFFSRKLFSYSVNPSKMYTIMENFVPRISPHFASISHSTPFFNETIVVHTPPFADSIKEGDIKWQCTVGDEVDEDEILGEIETDKTSIPILAPFDGIVQVLYVSNGETVVEKDKLFEIKRNISNIQENSQISNQTTNALESQLQSRNVNIPTNDGIMTAGEFPQESQTVENLTQTFTDLESEHYPKDKPVSSHDRPIRRIKMSRMRLKISERLKESQNTAAMLTTFNEVNMKFILSLREQYKNIFLKTHELKFGIMSPFIKGTAYALERFPLINAVIENGEILYRDFIDISVAISTSKGLVVPVIKDVNYMNYLDIERRLNELSNLARKNSLSVDDLYGGTFTITNGGVFGSLYGTPIINPPQSAILGMHGIKERPIVINGKIEIMPMMYLALTYDHRLIDGREAVLFLKKIVEVIENPLVMLLDL